MNRSLNTVFVLILVMTLTACATTPKIAMRPEVRESIITIALVETPEPEQYFMSPAPSPASGALLIFGAIGGAIAGGIEATREQTATKKFTETVAPLKPGLVKKMLARLEEGLLDKGYITQCVPPPAMTKDGKNYDFTKLDGDYDAILVAKLVGGYCGILMEGVSPEVRVSISIYSKTGNDLIFADTYYYSSRIPNNENRIVPDPKYNLKSAAAIYDDISVAIEGMKTGVRKLAERVASDL